MAEKNIPAPREQGAESRKVNRSARVVQVIAVETAVGTGTQQNPNRIITEYWSLKGELLAVQDPETCADG